MSIIKAEGIILRSMKMGETSKLLTMFTREHGILKVIAKGSRSRKSRFGGSLELLNVVHIVYYHKDSRDLQLLSAADIEETFPALSLNLEKWGYALACGELIIRAHPAAEATPKLYPILLDSLRAMNENLTPNDRACFWGLQMKLLGVFGVPPNLRKCLHCENEPSIVTDQRLYFHLGRGGFFCEKCRQGVGTIQLDRESLRQLANLQTLPARKILQQSFAIQTTQEIENFFQSYFRLHLEEIGRLQALEFIGEINFREPVSP